MAEEGRRLWNEGPPAPTARLGGHLRPGKTGCSRTRTSMVRLSTQKRLHWKCRANPEKPQVFDVIDGTWMRRTINETIKNCAKFTGNFKTRICCETNNNVCLGYYPDISCGWEHDAAEMQHQNPGRKSYHVHTISTMDSGHQSWVPTDRVSRPAGRATSLFCLEWNTGYATRVNLGLYLIKCNTSQFLRLG